MENLNNNIWFTRKARIVASERLLNHHFHSQLLLIYYSLLNVSLSVYAIKNESFLGENTSIALTVMAICVLVVSLIVTNIDFKTRANKLKENYIDLQELYSSNLSKDEKWKSYTALLKRCENHKDIDDKIFRVKNAAFLQSRKPTKRVYFSVFFFVIVKFLLLTTLYLAPLYSIYLMLKVK